MFKQLKSLALALALALPPLFISGGAQAAAITPTSTTRASMGNYSLIIARFTNSGTNDADDTDTWTSGMTGVVAFWTQDIENPTTQASVGTAVTEASGVFTFYPAEDTKLLNLYVLVAN